MPEDSGRWYFPSFNIVNHFGHRLKGRIVMAAFGQEHFKRTEVSLMGKFTLEHVKSDLCILVGILFRIDNCYSLRQRELSRPPWLLLLTLL